MDSKTQELVSQWKATLSQKEKELHEMAAVMLKKTINVDTEKDNGSYYEEKCHAFVKWRKANSK